MCANFRGKSENALKINFHRWENFVTAKSTTKITTPRKLSVIYSHDCYTYFTVDTERQSIVRGGIVSRVAIRSVSVTALPRNIQNCLHEEIMSLFTTFSGCSNVYIRNSCFTYEWISINSNFSHFIESWVDLLEFAAKKKNKDCLVYRIELYSSHSYSYRSAGMVIYAHMGLASWE